MAGKLIAWAPMHLPDRTLPSDEIDPPLSERAAEGVRLRRLATGLLLLMVALLGLSTWAIRAVHPQFVWVQAFAEAALVGGLADWFAVTALFRRPMGLPIPHTAIIPRSKDRIGEALANFLKDNFLTAGNVVRRLEGFDAASALASILERPASGGRVRLGLSGLLRQLADTPAASEVVQKLQQGTLTRLESLEVSPLLGQMLQVMLENGRHRPVLDQLIAWSNRTLDSEEQLVRSMVEERTGWLLKLVNVDNRIADELLKGIRGLLAELADNPQHPVRLKAEAALQRFALQLQHDDELRAKVERLKRDLLQNPAVANWLEGIWTRAKHGLHDLLLGDGFAAIGQSMAQALQTDPMLRQAVNQLARRSAASLATDHGAAIVTLVSDTVKGWDAATITNKMEYAVLRDLQYIRLNGTLIGGLIGMLIHAVLLLAHV